jgi:mannitol/fructose-specific phosphotransferase system IIA component (Ntr-type)
VGIVGLSIFLFQVGLVALIIGMAFTLAGFSVYWFYGRARVTGEYALLHLVERITARELTTRTLEQELKGIIRERDNIVADRFDHLIETCVILDLDGRMTLDEFLTEVANHLADRVGVRADILVNQLAQRERESTTAISPILAIPHVVLEGEHTFNLLLARCKEGINFSPAAPRVQAVFILVGTMDERNFHLQAISAVAQIVCDPDFERAWLEARTVEDLRDLVLLAQRRRANKTPGP